MSNEIPDDPWGAFGYLVSRCASGILAELVDKGRSETETRNAIIHSFLDMAAGEACRVARREGREPDPNKWRKAVDRAFEKAVKRTAKKAL